MQVTVLGCGAAFPRAGGACSGYLIDGGGVRVWVDAGNGTLANLQRHASYGEIDALILSHRHSDHVADVLPLMYARSFDDEITSPLAVYAPEDVAPSILIGHGEYTLRVFEEVFDLGALDDLREIGGLRFEPFRTLHPVETYGLRVTEGDATFVYTADTGMFDDLPGACSGADVLLCEATYVRGVDGPADMHMWAEDAGTVASKAGAGRLVLTHVWPTVDRERSVAEASRSYTGPIEAATEGDVYRM